MDKIPTYQDINRARLEESAKQEQLAQRNAVAREAQSVSSPNPVLAEYMRRMSPQQGLIPSTLPMGGEIPQPEYSPQDAGLGALR